MMEPAGCKTGRFYFVYDTVIKTTAIEQPRGQSAFLEGILFFNQ